MDKTSQQYKDFQKNMASQKWRLNNIYWIVNEKGQKVKFQLNMVQQILYRFLWFLSIILKSRQHGVTTFFCILYLDICLFNSNVRAGIIAHNREDAEAFFKDKVKFAYDNLPKVIKDGRPAKTDSARELLFTNNSAIRVGTSLRSGTLQYLHISEFGKLCRKFPDKAKEIVTGALNTVHAGQFIAIESTAEGNEGYFFDYCQDAKKKKEGNVKLTKLDFKFFFFPWWQDPRNALDVQGVIISKPLDGYFRTLKFKHHITLNAQQKAWYSKKWETQGDEMKREHPSTPEEAFEARIEGAYFTSQFQKIYKEKRITVFPLEEGYPVDTWWDLGVRASDTTAIWFTQTIGHMIHVFDFYENYNEGLPFYKDYLRDAGYKFGKHTAPHDINNTEWGTGKTRVEKALELGIDFEIAPRLRKDIQNDADQISAARSIFPHCIFHEVNCADGIKALENYRREWDDKRGTYRDKPYHNWASNPADAFITMAVAHEFASIAADFTPKRQRAA